MSYGRYSGIVLFLLLVLLALYSCSSSWKDWNVVRNEIDFQIREDPGGVKWMYLRKRRSSAQVDDFQYQAGPFDGFAPKLVNQFNWTGPYLDSVFGSKDSIQYLKTVVLCNQRIEENKNFCDIRILNDHGEVIRMYSMDGICRQPRVIARDRQCLIFAGNDSGQRWLLLDYLTGKQAGPAIMELPRSITESSIRELDFIRDKIIITEQLMNQIVVHLFDAAGSPLEKFIIPGEFKGSAHNGIDKKLVVTQHGTETFADLVLLNNLKLVPVVGVADAVGQGLAGMSTEVQYHKTGGKDRWVYAAFQHSADQQNIRILDENGNLLKTQVSNGQIKATQIMGKQSDRMVWALDRIENIDMVVIDLSNGQVVNTVSMPGKFKNMFENPDHLNAWVFTDRIGSILKHELPLY
ncbi:MAG: hypothetical protein SH818_12925 [Saprospiraceae bacterium]|nr:hypothetical protein [Saprospiraceae bacterium]